MQGNFSYATEPNLTKHIKSIGVQCTVMYIYIKQQRYNIMNNLDGARLKENKSISAIFFFIITPS